MAGVKVVSFDLEGTLVDMAFSEKVWNEGLPRLYAQKANLDFEEAKRIVLGEYALVGEDHVEWYDIAYWFRHFGLSGDPEQLLESYKSLVHLFPESLQALKTLGARFRLVLTTNSNPLFIRVLARDIAQYFSHVFSVTSKFRLLKRNSEAYRQICLSMGIKPTEMAHVGDRLLDDYKSPRSIGIRAYLLSRTGEDCSVPEEFKVMSLKEFADRLLRAFNREHRA
ncbi:MAG: HAD family hydrolase [Nitrososphaerota archaeon]|nr:HAD family hydrolase [Candidatus Bathyarchaeota archaeon]MDW8193608.1 HAD family hydrolase [Nitrososphaerota archaeon]